MGWASRPHRNRWQQVCREDSDAGLTCVGAVSAARAVHQHPTWPESGRATAGRLPGPRLGSHGGSGSAGLRAPARLSLGFYRTRTPTHPERLHSALGATESESCRVRAQRPILPSARPSRLAGESWQSRRSSLMLAPSGGLHDFSSRKGRRQPSHATTTRPWRSGVAKSPVPSPCLLKRAMPFHLLHPLKDGPCRDSSRLPPASVRLSLPARPPASRVPAAAHALRGVVLAANHATSLPPRPLRLTMPRPLRPRRRRPCGRARRDPARRGRFCPAHGPPPPRPRPVPAADRCGSRCGCGSANGCRERERGGGGRIVRCQRSDSQSKLRKRLQQRA
jgi:hypothetical protein